MKSEDEVVARARLDLESALITMELHPKLGSRDVVKAIDKLIQIRIKECLKSS